MLHKGMRFLDEMLRRLNEKKLLGHDVELERMRIHQFMVLTIKCPRCPICKDIYSYQAFLQNRNSEYLLCVKCQKL